MDPVFHRFVYELGIWRILGQSCGQDGKSLHIEDLVLGGECTVRPAWTAYIPGPFVSILEVKPPLPSQC